tara:strand:+ start:1126 stop:1248 length:123 start_codon:yes stop_codon:yes gene_type:complete
MDKVEESVFGSVKLSLFLMSMKDVLSRAFVRVVNCLEEAL